SRAETTRHTHGIRHGARRVQRQELELGSIDARPVQNHSTGWRTGKLRSTSSTVGSGSSRFHNARYSGLSRATPANTRQGWRTGHSLSYITSGGLGHAFLSAMN